VIIMFGSVDGGLTLVLKEKEELDTFFNLEEITTLVSLNHSMVVSGVVPDATFNLMDSALIMLPAAQVAIALLKTTNGD
jgi:hypothetical protein